MNRLFILLLLYVLSAGSVIAAMIEPNDVSFPSSGGSSFVHEITTENNLTTLSEFPQATQSDVVPPTLWIVGLGLCLVLLGYKMKNKAE